MACYTRHFYEYATRVEKLDETHAQMMNEAVDPHVRLRPAESPSATRRQEALGERGYVAA